MGQRYKIPRMCAKEMIFFCYKFHFLPHYPHFSSGKRMNTKMRRVG